VKKILKDKKEEPLSEIRKAEPEPSTKITDSNYNRNKHYKKGVSLMADERLEDAARAFEDALRIDPRHMESLLKLGYARFHMNDFAGAM